MRIKFLILSVICLLSTALAQDTEYKKQLNLLMCDILGSFITMFPIISYYLFIFAAALFIPTVILTVWGWRSKKDKTEKEAPQAYRYFRWGIRLLKMVTIVVVLAVVASGLYYAVPVIVSKLTGASLSNCVY
jgi:phosphoglycerol transferase MdoB-like AlkP superfamily enzyme